MAFGARDQNTQTTTVTSTHTLATITSSDIYVLHVDLGPMANGSSTDAADEVELIIQTICRTSGTERIAFKGSYKGSQIEPQKYSAPIPSDVSIKFQLKHVAGVSRDFPWKVYGLV